MPNKTLFLILLLSGILFPAAGFSQGVYQQKLDCFSIVVGRNASADGSVIVAHNEDTGMKIVNHYKVPPLKHTPGEKLRLKNGAEIPQVKETLGYNWINIPGIDVCDSYINEAGVTIASDGCPSKVKNPELTNGGISFWFRRIIAERAHTAREGVEIAGKLIEEYGYASSGRTYIIADSKEGWMFSVTGGKHWIAHRVPDDEVAVIPNYYTIGEIDLLDESNYLGSPEIINYAISQKWYNPQIDGEFHFARVYSKPGSLNHPGNYKRMWRGVSLVSGKKYEITASFPFSVKPKNKLSIQDLMSILRDHYEGTELDKTNNCTTGNPIKLNGPTICAGGTQYSFVAHLRDWLPVEIGSVMWYAPYRSDVQSFVPWYSGTIEIPEKYGFGNYKSAITQQYDPSDATFIRNNDHAFWHFVSVVEKVDENYVSNAPKVKNEWIKTENELFKDQVGFEKKVLKTYNQDPEKAKTLLTNYSIKKSNRIYKIAVQLIKKL